MKLRIVAGSLRGRMIEIPAKDCDFRPTRERIRESVASILADAVMNARVADVCAGSGSFGFEMASRGAAAVTFIESDTFRCRGIQNHAKRFGVEDLCTVHATSLAAYLKRSTEQFDMIFYDPPYDITDFCTYIDMLFQRLSSGGILVYERRNRSTHPPFSEHIQAALIDRRTYGETEICIFKKTIILHPTIECD